jgi:hypothetical protein
MLRGAAASGMSHRARQTPRPISPAPTTTTRLSRSPAVLAAGHRHGGVGERRGPPGDAGLGAHPLARLQRVLEERREDRPADALFPGVLEGPADLADHLALARTVDSSPEVTEKRWEVTSSSKRMVARAASSSVETPECSDRTS